MLSGMLTLVQVTIGFGSNAAMDLAMETLRTAAAAGYRHALALSPKDDTPVPLILRVVEQASSVSKRTQIVIHPNAAASERGTTLERRWSSLLESASSLHPDVRLMLRIPQPAGLR